MDKAKRVSLAEALSRIQPGNRIYLGTACAAPATLLAALEAAQPGPADLEFVSFVTTSALPRQDGSPQTRHRHRVFFVGSDVLGLADTGQLEYVPISLEELPAPSPLTRTDPLLLMESDPASAHRFVV